MSTDEDRARLIAALIIAAQSVKSQTSDIFQVRLEKAKEALRGSHWSITVGRDLKCGLREWIDHPWHCYKLKHLVPKLLNHDLSGMNEEEASILLARCCAMVEFGVDVNPMWYRRLREAVVDHKVSAHELRSLLRHSTVWWGTSVATTSGPNSLSSIFRSIWSMGRPSEGELLIRQHHWLTKATILTMLCLSGLAFGIVGYSLIQFATTHGTIFGAAGLITATLTYGGLFWATSWIGPGSWSAVARLQTLLHSTTTS